jgi:hypothetical protein
LIDVLFLQPGDGLTTCSRVDNMHLGRPVWQEESKNVERSVCRTSVVEEDILPSPTTDVRLAGQVCSFQLFQVETHGLSTIQCETQILSYTSSPKFDNCTKSQRNLINISLTAFSSPLTLLTCCSYTPSTFGSFVRSIKCSLIS